jgi:chitodextrinase
VAAPRNKNKTTLIRNRTSFRPYQVVIAVAVLVVAGAYLVARGHAATGTLSVLPASSTVGVGNTFTVAVHENSGTDAVNAVEADLTYPASQLQFVSIDATTSAFGVEAVSTGGNGTVTLARGVTGGAAPLTGDQLVANVTFKALVAGGSPAVVAFAGTSALVRASDQTNVLVGKNSGTYTIADQTPPSVPTGITAGTRTMTSVAFTWTASTDNVGVTGYKVFRNGTQVGTPTATSFTDANGLTPGTSYNYTVSAFDAAGNNSAQSAAVAIATLPDTQAPTVPGVPTSPSQTMSSISLSWAASTDNVAVTGYKVFRNGTQITSSTSTSFNDTGLVPNTTYTYTVSAFDAAGNASAQSAGAALKTLPDTQAPTAPGNLTSTQTRQNINLTFAASTDNVGVTGYIIYRDNVQIATTASLSYADSSVTVGNHVYGVAATDGAGNVSAITTLGLYVYAVADINRDGSVNIFDLSTLLSNWGKTGANTSDINGDSVVNIFDLSALLTAWTG